MIKDYGTEKVQGNYLRVEKLREPVSFALQRVLRRLSSSKTGVSCNYNAVYMAKSHNSAPIEFLFTELDTGLTFARIAVGAKPDSTRTERNRKNARKAYDSLLHFQEKTPMSPSEKTRLEAGKKELREALRSLGEKV